MLWFLLWTFLVLGTCVGAFFLGRDLFRKARGLAHELERVADLTAAMAEAAEARVVVTEPAPVSLLDPEPARLRMAEARLRRLARRLRREERHTHAYERWQSFAR